MINSYGKGGFLRDFDNGMNYNPQFIGIDGQAGL
jgi:hypothetical protein